MRRLNDLYKRPTVYIVVGRKAYRPKRLVDKLKLKLSTALSLKNEVYDVLPSPGELLILVDPSRLKGSPKYDGLIVVSSLDEAFEVYDELLSLGFD